MDEILFRSLLSNAPEDVMSWIQQMHQLVIKYCCFFSTDEYFQKPRQNSRDLNNEDDENVENVDTDVNGAYRDILGPTL